MSKYVLDLKFDNVESLNLRYDFLEFLNSIHVDLDPLVQIRLIICNLTNHYYFLLRKARNDLNFDTLMYEANIIGNHYIFNVVDRNFFQKFVMLAPRYSNDTYHTTISKFSKY